MSRFGRRGDRETTDVSVSASAGEREVSASSAVPVAAPAVPRREEGASSRDMNVFTEGLTIDGNVTSETGIVIRGTVNGNVSCRADVEISGEITGDVEGKNVRITGGGIKGNITAGEMLSIDRSRIKGNLSAMHARVNNPIEGDISVRGTLTLQREANIQGNITAAGLSVEEGASMNGRITISRERSEGSYAPQTSRSVSSAPKRSAPKPAPVPDSSASAGITVSVIGKPAEEKAADKHLPLTDEDKLFTTEP